VQFLFWDACVGLGGFYWKIPGIHCDPSSLGFSGCCLPANRALAVDPQKIAKEELTKEWWVTLGFFKEDLH
jgi:hypothetical protein